MRWTKSDQKCLFLQERQDGQRKNDHGSELRAALTSLIRLDVSHSPRHSRASSRSESENKNAALLQRLRTNTSLLMTDASKQNGEILQRAQRGSKPGVTQRAKIKARLAANMQPAEASHRGAPPLKLYLGQILLCRTNRVPRCIHATQPRSINTAPPRWVSSALILSAAQTCRVHLGTDACWETRQNPSAAGGTREQNVLSGTSSTMKKGKLNILFFNQITSDSSVRQRHSLLMRPPLTRGGHGGGELRGPCLG